MQIIIDTSKDSTDDLKAAVALLNQMIAKRMGGQVQSTQTQNFFSTTAPEIQQNSPAPTSSPAAGMMNMFDSSSPQTTNQTFDFSSQETKDNDDDDDNPQILTY